METPRRDLVRDGNKWVQHQRTEALIDALAVESGNLLIPQPTVPPMLTAHRHVGVFTEAKAMVIVHSPTSVTINLFSVEPAVALRVAKLLGEVLR